MNGYVLAGGASRRMGVDKARLPLEGWPVAVRLYERLAAAGLTPHLIRRVDDGLPWVRPDGEPLSVVWEADQGTRHPLNGVLTALIHANGPVLVVPCDVLALTTHSLVRLIEAGPCWSGHPLIAVMPHEPERVRQAIAAGASVHSVVGGLPLIEIPAQERWDRNEGGGPWPDTLLVKGWGLVGPEAERVASAERLRLRARGVVVPVAEHYAGQPGGSP